MLAIKSTVSVKSHVEKFAHGSDITAAIGIITLDDSVIEPTPVLEALRMIRL